MSTTRPNSSGDTKKIPYAAGSLFRQNPLTIGRRLTVCFLLIMASMIGAGAVVFWQFGQMVVPSRRLINADRTSLALARLRLDVDTFRENVAALEKAHETEQFSTEAAGFKQGFLRDVEDAQQALGKAPELVREDPTIPVALETLKVTLPSQLDTTVQLAATGDWNAVRLRLEHQIQDLIDLSSSLVAKVDRQAQQQRTNAIEDAERARHGLFVVLLIAGLLTLILAATLGWYATQSITVPLSELASGAQALARGDLSHQVNVYGSDELAVVGRAFNHAAGQLQALYEELREQASLLSLTHDAIYVRDMKGVIRYWNHGAEELYGWSAEHAVGKLAHELLQAVSPLPFEQIEAELLRSGGWEGELVKTKKDGTRLVVSSRCSLKHDDRGQPVAILVTSNDISERKRAEEALRRLNRELQAISNCNQTLLRATDEQSLLQEICRIVCEEAGYRMAWVAYAEHDEAKSVRPVAWIGAEAGYLASAGVTWADTERGRGPTGTAIRSGKTCCIQDFATDLRAAPWREGALLRDFRSGIALPLKDEHANAFGSLSIHSAEPNAFTPEEVRLLEELAADLAFGIVTLRSRAARKQAEQALRQSEAYLAEAQRLSHTGSWGWNVSTGEYDYWSEETLRIYGFDPREGLATGEDLFQRIHPEDRDRWRKNFEKSLREKVDTSDEYRIVLPDGTVKHIHAIRHPVLNDAGDLVRFVGTAIDVTERKRAEEALRRSEAYLTETQRLTHTGTWVADPTTAPLYWSEELFRIFGFDPQHGLPTPNQPPQRIHPEDRDKFWQTFQKIIHEKVDSDVEYRIVLPDGTFKHIYGLGHPVLNANGELIEIVGTVVDITERKRAEEALRRSEAYLAEAQRLTHTGSWALDAATPGYTYWSEEMFRIFGFEPHQGIPIRETMIHRFHPEDRSAWKGNLEKTFREKVVTSDEHRIVLPDGTIKHVYIIRHPILNDAGELVEVVGTTVDITERKRAEEQRERLRQLEADLAHVNRVSMMGELTASIAHEVNQPLSGVVSNGGACLRWLAGDSPNLEEAREAARRIVRDGKRAGEVIARIRALTKKAPTPREKLNLNETLHQVLVLIGDQAKKNRVMIRTQFADDLSPVSGDQVQLQQVVLNLAMNAIEAMSSVGERAREMVITTRNIDADQVQVTVEDSGVGLDPNTMQKIFEPFYTTKPTGMGMGLSISRSILQSHGGRLWATANDGPGTMFHFTLPKYHEEESNVRVA